MFLRTSHSAGQTNWEVVDTRTKEFVYFLNPCAPLSNVASNTQLQSLLNVCFANQTTTASACQVNVATPTTNSPKYMGMILRWSICYLAHCGVVFADLPIWSSPARQCITTGASSPMLTSNGDFFELSMTDGDGNTFCHGAYKRTTIIRFVCGVAMVRECTDVVLLF